MRSVFTRLALVLVLFFPYRAHAAEIGELAGTWSGSWLPHGGVIDALTVELHTENGKLTGKFKTPVAMDFSKATFDSKTGTVALEATDPKSAKTYKITGKLNGQEIKGTLMEGDLSGDLLLIKWTYVPR